MCHTSHLKYLTNNCCKTRTNVVTNPQGEDKMEVKQKSSWEQQFTNIGYYRRGYRARREAYHESERFVKMFNRKVPTLWVSRCNVCNQFVGWNKVTRKVHLLTKDDYGYWFNDKDFHSRECRISSESAKTSQSIINEYDNPSMKGEK